MTLQTILYFISILLTCALTGFLAAYAWKHRQSPGSSAYARLALSECLFALAEILSVLSPSSPMALFWFQARYLLGAFIAVFWFIFALEYNGHRAWLSKRLLAGLWVIPLITQALLWSNSLHGLWMRQEVGFIQKGPFLIADISSRIAGIGYLTHSFYTLLLTLAGIVLMLLTAWKLRREFIAQALMLAGAGLTAFFFLVNALFNLFPKMEFNPFTPGLGLSMLLIALAVFRFQFLKRAPAEGVAPRRTDLPEPEKRSLVLLLLVFLLLASGISASAYLSYANYERQFRAQVDKKLSVITDLKVNGLRDWRAERLGDAEALRQNPAFAALVQAYLENPQDAQTAALLQAWFDSLYAAYQYDRVFLLDTNGIERLASPRTPEPVAAHLAEDSAAALASGQVTFIDFHRDTAKNKIYLAVLVPVFGGEAARRSLGALVLRVDPEITLYPYLQEWPAPSETAETLLVRREGESILYLNPVRFNLDAALNLRIPLTNTEVLAVKAALGQTGVVEGRDYRGSAVIGALAPVPGTPWFLVARMDTAEVYAPLRERLWEIGLFYGVLLALSGSGLLFFWRQQRVRYYRAQMETLDALRASEEKFRLAFDTSPDSVSITRLADGMFVSVNKGFEQISGYTRGYAIGKTSAEINIWKNPEDRRKVVEGLQAKGEVRNYEAPFLTRSGEIYGLMSAAIITLNGGPHILSIIRDITERKRVEAELKLSENRYRKAQTIGHVGNWEYNLENTNFWGSEEAKRIYGFEPDTSEFLTEEVESCIPNRERVHQALVDLIEKETPYDLEFDIITKDQGEKKMLRSIAVLEKDAAGKPLKVTGVVQDITERRRAESALRDSEQRFRATFEQAAVGIAQVGLDGRWLRVNQRLCDIVGYTSDELFLLTFQDITHPDDLETDLDYVRQMLAGEIQTYAMEKRYIRKDRSHVWINLTVSLVRDEAAAPKYFISAIEDITERKLVEQKLAEYSTGLAAMVDERTRELREAQEKLLRQERLAALGQVAGSIGHELRNPLGVIANAVYFLKMSQPEASDKVKEYLDIIDSETRASDKIVTDLLDFTRLKSVHREPAAVSELVHQTLEHYPAPPGIQVSLEIPAGLPPIYADPQHVLQALGNLVVNACQAMEAPDAMQLTVSATVQSDMIRVEVRDTGMGIPPENMGKLFEPLFTTKTKGIGLGLAVSKKLIEANGGRIEVVSEPGQGSTFTLVLPIYK